MKQLRGVKQALPLIGTFGAVLLVSILFFSLAKPDAAMGIDTPNEYNHVQP